MVGNPKAIGNRCRSQVACIGHRHRFSESALGLGHRHREPVSAPVNGPGYSSPPSYRFSSFPPTRYTPPMRITRLAGLWICILAASALSFAQTTAQPMLVRGDDGASIDWNQWLAEHGPCAVVLWASWLPGDERSVDRLTEIRRVAQEHGLTPVVVALQEPISASRKALASTDFDWLHDRHGTMLKHLLVYQIPTVVVIDTDGSVLARLTADPGALKHWVGTR